MLKAEMNRSWIEMKLHNFTILESPLLQSIAGTGTWRLIHRYSGSDKSTTSRAVRPVVSGWAKDLGWLSYLRHKGNDLGSVLSEERFHSVLTNESKRSARSGLPFHVLLVCMPSSDGLPLPMEGDVARKMFSVLTCAFRNTDYVGWYWEDKIAGAILPVLRHNAVAQTTHPIEKRVEEVLQQCLTARNSTRLLYRVSLRHELMQHPLPYRSQASGECNI
jgi:hypothetical protein